MSAALTTDQQARVAAARELLDAEHGYDAAELAPRVGRLEWHLAEMLALVGELRVNNEAGPGRRSR